MESTFGGFSEDDVKRIQSGTPEAPLEDEINSIKKIDKIGAKHKRKDTSQYKLKIETQISDTSIDNFNFEKCKLSLKTPTPDILNNNNLDEIEANEHESTIEDIINESINIATEDNSDKTAGSVEDRKLSNVSVPDLTNNIKSNYTENELVAHKAKLEDLQLRQKLMEEQNKKRKEMLAKALADRTKQTEDEVMKLQKIRKELQILDGQFSQDVSVLRKKIDQACVTYSEAEKNYLKVEKEFLQSKINLQKEKEKKELLTEHLCALITHNETRKAKKLETLMLQLAYDVNSEEVTNCDQGIVDEDLKSNDLSSAAYEEVSKVIKDDSQVIVDGVDEKTGKFVDINLG